MKKTILSIMSILVIFASASTVSAKVNPTNAATATAIKYYKSGNYVQSYLACEDIVKKDPSNALAEYYLAMSQVQLGNKDAALSAYEKVMMLSPNGILGRYAKKGKKCLETPELCHEPDKDEMENETAEDKFIKGAFGSGFSIKARGVHEREQIEDLRREINRNQDIPPQKFKDYKDFSTYEPNNDDIVAAIRILQRAGLFDLIDRNTYGSDVSFISGNNTNENNRDILNLLLGKNSGTSNLSPQVIQSLLTTQMSTNF